MVDIATLGIAVDSRQVKTAQRDLDNLAKTGQRTEKQTDQIGAAFRRLAGPLAAYLGTRQIAESAEQWTTLNNRLRLVTDSTEEFLAAQDDVFRIAQSSRQPLQATAELYQRIATNADELKLSGAGVAAVVDTINKTLAISGTSGASAQAALVQLGQAFASGTLRGEELNSVLEQAPALAKAIADGMGVSVGQLRALGQEGVLTAQNVIDALLSQADAVDSQFSRIQKTASQAFTTLGNSLTRVVGEIDAATGASVGLADAIVGVSQYLDSGALTDEILHSMAVWRETVNATIASLSGLRIELALLEDIGGDSASFVGRAFKEMPANITTAIRVAVVEVTSLIDRAGNAVQTLDEALAALVTDDTVAEAFARGEARYKALLQAREDSLQAIFDEREAILGAADAEQRRREQERRERQRAREEREKDIAALREAATGVTLPTVGDDKASKEAEREAKRLLDAYRNLEASLLEQIALHGDTSEAASLRYQLEHGELAKLTEAEKEHLLALREKLDAKEQEAEKARELQEVLESLRTAEEAAIDAAAEMYRVLDEAFQRGAISLDEYFEATSRIDDGLDGIKEKTEETADEMSKRWEHAMDRMQSAFADFLYDPFKDGLDGMLKNFGDILRRMAAEMAAAAVFDKLAEVFGFETGSLREGAAAVSKSAAEMQIAGGTLITGAAAIESAAASLAAASSSGGGSSSGGWAQALSSIFQMAGSFDGGGFTGRGPRVGGLDGKGGMLALVHPNETIIDHTRGQTAGTTVQIGQMVFPNVTTERQAREATGAAARSLSRIANAGQRYA